MRAALLAFLVACGTDEPADACADALVNQESKPGCSLGDQGALDVCHRREPIAMCRMEFDAFIACLSSNNPSQPACDCFNEEALLRACAG